MVHASEDGAFADLEPIQMEDWENCTRLFGVDVLDAVPRAIGSQTSTKEREMQHSRRSRPSLGFTITNNTGNNEVRVIHHSTKRHSQCITQLSTFVNCAGCLSVDVTEIWISSVDGSKRKFYLGKPPVVLNFEMSW